MQIAAFDGRYEKPLAEPEGFEPSIRFFSRITV